jgi:pantetheine-phosphate adenylyltransferase
MRRAVCPGSFDPVTNGHLDIVERASGLFDEIIIAIGVNPSKRALFTGEERTELLAEVTAGLPNVRIERFAGLLVDFCRCHDVHVVVKGLRAISDFDYELQMSQMNHGLAGVETLFMPTNPIYSFLSSSLVREVATYGGDVSGLVPATVLARLGERLGNAAGR